MDTDANLDGAAPDTLGSTDEETGPPDTASPDIETGTPDAQDTTVADVDAAADVDADEPAEDVVEPEPDAEVIDADADAVDTEVIDAEVIDAEVIDADAVDTEVIDAVDVAEQDGADTDEGDGVSGPDGDIVLDAEPDTGPDTATDVETDADSDVESDVDTDVDSDVDSDAEDVADVPDVPAEARPDGAPCVADVQCGGGTCYLAPEFPGGYCTTLGCESFEDCTGTEAVNRCWLATDVCVQVCETSAECREGYICDEWQLGEGRCWPPVGSPPPIAEPDGGIEVRCGYIPADDYTVNMDFYIEESTTSFMVVPFGRDLSETVPLRLIPPGREPITFNQRTDTRVDPWRVFRWYNPLMIPYTPSLADELVPGVWGMEVESLAREVCFYVMQEADAGNTFDVRVTLVGAGGLSAESVPSSDPAQEMITVLRGVFEGSGVRVGDVTFHDAAPEVVEAYRIVRTHEDARRLFSTTSPQGDTRSDLRIDVFLVDDVAMSGTNTYGTSGGLPGPAGLWGTPASGVVVTAEYLADGRVGWSGPEFTGTLIAHEIGHFLGLRHTSESSGNSHDDLADTIACATWLWPSRCPDIDNLMFGQFTGAQTELTPGQVFQMLANPLTR